MLFWRATQHRACRREEKELYHTKFPFYFRILLFSNGRKSSKERLRKCCGFLSTFRSLTITKRKKTQKKTLITLHNLHPLHVTHLFPLFFSPLFWSRLLIFKLFSFFFSISFQTKEEQKKERKKTQRLPVRIGHIPT